MGAATRSRSEVMREAWFLLIPLIALQGCDREQTVEPRAELLIRDVTIVSPGGKLSTGAANVVVRGGRIVAIGDVTADATTIVDGTGRFLIPGLIDSHAHLNEIPGMTYDQERSFSDVASDARDQIPRSYLYHGFTTVIDLNSQPQAIAGWNAQAMRPHAYFCGASPIIDGYPMSFMPKPARYEIMPYFLYDETRSGEFPDGIDELRHTPSAVVNRIQSDGGICVKTHFERGFGERRDLPVPTVRLVRALAQTAHEKGMPVLMHANSEEAQSFGVKTDIDAFAHGMWTWNDRSLTTVNATISEIVATAVENNIALQPTIQVLHGERDVHNPDYFDDPRLKHVLPISLINWYQGEAGQWWAQEMRDIPFVAELLAEGRWNELNGPPLARVTAVLTRFAESGGLLLFGSDTPSGPTFANPPGLNGRIEMDTWIEAGVSPSQLLDAATISNAEFFGLGGEIGSVAVGMRADLLLLRENPLQSVRAYDTIEYVFLNGSAIKRSSLSALNSGH